MTILLKTAKIYNKLDNIKLLNKIIKIAWSTDGGR